MAVGDRTYVNRHCLFDNSAAIAIGSDCAIGTGVTLMTSTHDLGPSERRAGALRGAPIRIGDGSWLGARVVVLPGVSIAPGCVVAAGAVVTRDTAPDGLYAGIPARRLRGVDASAAAERG